MNPRIFKKLCKRSVVYIEKIKDIRPNGGFGFYGLYGLDGFVVINNDIEICDDVKVDYDHLCRQPYIKKQGYFDLLKNTKGFVYKCGYEYDEWEHIFAYTLLLDLVLDHYTDWSAYHPDNDMDFPAPSIRIRDPHELFKHADLMIAAIGGEA